MSIREQAVWGQSWWWRAYRWIRYSLAAKVLLVSNLLLVIAVTTSASITFWIARDALRQEIIFSGRELVESFAKTNALDFLDAEQGPLNLKLRLKNVVERTPERRVVAAVVLDHRRKVLARAGEGLGGEVGPLDLADHGPAQVVPTVASEIVIAAPVIYDDVLLGHIVFAFSDTAVAEAGTRILSRSGAVILALVLLNVVFLVLLLRALLRPVVHLGRAAEEYARGNFEHRVGMDLRDDEIGVAARSFDDMCDSLDLHMRFSNAALVDRIRHKEELYRAEEYQLSIFFGDAVGYTPWSNQQDTETVFSTLTRYYSCLGQVSVKMFSGILNKFMGDGVMGHFGLLRARRSAETPAPGAAVPREEVRDALRAIIYCQLVFRVLSHAIRTVEQRDPLAYRFGIASGFCRIGAVGAKEVMLDYGPIGNVVNLASRLEGSAPPGGLAIDRFTFLDGAEGFVECREVGNQRIKGVDVPIPIFLVSGFSDPIEVEQMRQRILAELFTDAFLTDIILDGRGDAERLAQIRAHAEHELTERPNLPTLRTNLGSG